MKVEYARMHVFGQLPSPKETARRRCLFYDFHAIYSVVGTEASFQSMAAGQHQWHHLVGALAPAFDPLQNIKNPKTSIGHGAGLLQGPREISALQIFARRLDSRSTGFQRRRHSTARGILRAHGRLRGSAWERPSVGYCGPHQVVAFLGFSGKATKKSKGGSPIQDTPRNWLFKTCWFSLCHRKRGVP